MAGLSALAPAAASAASAAPSMMSMFSQLAPMLAKLSPLMNGVGGQGVGGGLMQMLAGQGGAGGPQGLLSLLSSAGGAGASATPAASGPPTNILPPPTPTSAPPSGQVGAMTGAPAQEPGFFDRLNSGIDKTVNSPLYQMSTGLLARSGPQMQPHSFGQDLAGASQDYRTGQDNSEDRTYQTALRKAQMAKLKREQEIMDDPGGYISKMTGTPVMGGTAATPPKVQLGVPRYPVGYQGR
jgi:hypothetical protein